VGKVVMYSSVSVDGFVADENDQPGPLFDWLTRGDIALDESGALKVSQTSYDYIRPYCDHRLRVTASSRLPLATSGGRRLLRAWLTRFVWMSHLACSGRANAIRVGQRAVPVEGR